MSRLVNKRKAQAIEHLRHAKKRDAENGGSGTRTTSEIAERMGASVDQARRILWALADEGIVDAFSGEGAGGGPIYWRIAKGYENG